MSAIKELNNFLSDIKRHVINLTLVNDWTKKENVIRAVNEIPDNATVKSIYSADENITYITIYIYTEKQCEFSSNGSCMLECISCNGYGECKGGASI